MTTLLPGTSLDRSSDAGDAARIHAALRQVAGGRAGVAEQERVQAKLPLDAADRSTQVSTAIASPAPCPSPPHSGGDRSAAAAAASVDALASQVADLPPGGLAVAGSRGALAGAARTTAVALTAAAATAPTVFAYALPLLWLASPYPFLGTVGLGLAAFFGVLIATQVGTGVAVSLTRWLSRPPAVTPVLQAAMAHEAALPSPAEAPGGPTQATVSLSTLVRQARGAQTAWAAVGDQAEGDARADQRARREGLETRHGQIRVAVPCAPHARAKPQPLPTSFPLDWKRVVSYDGSAHNLVHFTGRPDSGSVWVATLLDGFAVFTWDKQLLRAGGEWLAGLFAGGWSGVRMVGGEFGFTHASSGWGARFNGSINRSQRTSEEVRLAQHGHAAEGRVPGVASLGLGAVPASGSDDASHAGPSAELAVHRQAQTWAAGWVRNVAAKYVFAQFFMRQDCTSQVHYEIERLVPRQEAADAQARVRGAAQTNGVGAWGSMFKGRAEQLPALASELVAAGSMVPLEVPKLPRLAEFGSTRSLQRVELGLDRTRGQATAVGQSGHLKTTAATFVGRHVIELGGRSLALMPASADDAASFSPPSGAGGPPALVTVHYARRYNESERSVLAITGGFGADQGDGTVDETEFTFTVSADSQAAVDALHSAMAAAHANDDGAQQETEATGRALRDLEECTRGAVTRCDRIGTTWSRDIGSRTALFGSQWWQHVLPAGWANALVVQRRAMQLQELHRRDDGARSSEHVMWAGRVVDGLSVGPRGSRSHSLWARVGYHDDEAPSVTFEAEWQLGRADAFDYRNYILQPLNEAFGLPLAMPYGGTWQTERSVRLRRTFSQRDATWLILRADAFAAAELAPLQARLRELFSLGRSKKKSNAAGGDGDAPTLFAATTAVQQAFASAFELHGARFLPAFASALGAGATELDEPGPGAVAPQPSPSSAGSAPSTPGERHELDEWKVTSTTEALAEPAAMEATIALERHLHPGHGRQHRDDASKARARIEPLMAMVYCDPLLGASTRRSQLQLLQQTQARLQASAAP